MNALASETSPYLLQHKDNPVEWMPWGEEAFRRAKELDRPIFLSVGYSTCHWCHVMARECFENPAIAALMNAHFVNVKVDREERPDVDQLYMAYVQATTGSGGWPMSVWLTPEGSPFFGGTYFPPEGRYGRAGFPSILEALARAWKHERANVREVASRAMSALASHAPPQSEGSLDSAAAAARRQFEHSYDREFGGFGGAPKFPRPSVFHFLMAREGAGRNMALETLRVLCASGIHDALGGGFHRYSVDRFWHVPHFEKMLYDQAQIVCALVEAWQLAGEGIFQRAAIGALDYVLRDLALPEGGLASAEDADSEPEGQPGRHAEGAFYVWEEAEIRKLLTSEEARLVLAIYNVRPGGNAPEGSDPHGEFLAKNILHARWRELESAESGPQAAMLREARRKLFEARARRPRPHRDNKVLTAWNGLALSALARAGAAFGEPRFVDAAVRVAEFLRTRLWDGRRLFRAWQGRPSTIAGFAEDYAFLTAGLLDLYEATAATNWLQWAVELQGILDREFWDDSGGGYFTSEQSADPLLKIRTKGGHDGAEPLAESVAAWNLLRFEAMGLPVPRRASEVMLSRRAEAAQVPTAFPALLGAWEVARRPPRQAVIAARPGAHERHEFVR
ncbi:MAG: thioredoxin domain-containing protein, partial [Terrimicrobiaceae bacterium]|nr:thioredoxin domain-containing protein [Terrimicrobiaceae bacterium]